MLLTIKNLTCQMDKDKLAFYREVFAIISQNKQSFSVLELGEAMRSFGIRASELELQDMVCLMDSNGSGEIEFDEFLELMLSEVSRDQLQDDLRKALRINDTRGNGFISMADLRQAMTRLGDRLSAEEVSRLFREANLDYEDEISIEELILILTDDVV